MPKPTDLRSTRVKRLTDSELYDRMLHGIGDDPVMDQTVPMDQRRRIVAYVRTLGRPRARGTR